MIEEFINNFQCLHCHTKMIFEDEDHFFTCQCKICFYFSLKRQKKTTIRRQIYININNKLSFELGNSNMAIEKNYFHIYKNNKSKLFDKNTRCDLRKLIIKYDYIPDLPFDDYDKLINKLKILVVFS